MILPILPIAFIFGAFWGWKRSSSRGGETLDKLQYATVHGILFTLIALVGVVIFDHLNG